MSVEIESGVAEYNLRAVRGDTFKRSIAFLDEDSLAIDITGWTIFFTVKSRLSNADGSAEADDTVTSHTDPTAGLSQISLSASDTAALSGDYFYDIQVKKSDGEIYTIMKGKILFESDTTLRTS